MANPQETGLPRDTSADRAKRIRSAVQRYEGPLITYATRILRDVERARDVVQETFLKLCQTDGDEVESVGPWLYAVCRHRALDVRRKEKRMSTLSTASECSTQARPSLEPSPPEAAETADETARVMEALSALTGSEAEAVRLKFRHGLRYAEIAKVMDVSVSHVGVLIHHGMKKLRLRLVPAGSPTQGGTTR